MMGSLLLDGAFGSRAKVQILRALCRSPRSKTSGNALARQVGMSPNTVHRALKELAAAGLIEVIEGPVTHEVRLRHDQTLTKAIIRLFDQEAGLREKAIQALKKAMPEDVTALLFGSMARGTAGPSSDIDLLIIAPTHGRAAEATMAARDALRRILPLPVRAIQLTPGEFRSHRRKSWLREATEEGIPLTKKRLEVHL